MKVRKVKLRGFLTYKDEIEIDFTKLFKNKIFLISGPTGSGKTTIFDAIAFALYGEVPRDIAMEDLRSDYLSENDPYTFVQVDFAIGEKIYQVLRVPSQRAVELKNPKNITHRIELYDISKEKILLAEKLKDADQKIKEIVGLDKGQFSKVMLLAQGQFQKFLISKSDEKADLLSDIFKTDALRAIQEELKERSKENRKKIAQVDTDLENVINYNEILSEKIDIDLILRHDFKALTRTISKSQKSFEESLTQVEKFLAILENEEKNLIQNLEKAKNLNENIEKYKNADLAYKNLYQDFEKNSQIKKDIDLLDYGLSIKIYEDRLENRKEDLIDFIKRQKNSQILLEEKNKSLEAMANDCENLPTLKKELDSLKIKLAEKQKEIADFEDFLRVKKAYESIKDLDKKSKDLDEKIKIDEKNLEDLRKDYDKISHDLTQAKEDAFSLKEKIGEVTIRLEKLDKDYKKLLENKSYRQSLDHLVKDLEKLEKDKQRADLDKDHFEINKLIDRLNEEGLCPVCGKSHTGTKEKYQVLDLDIEKIEKDLSDIKIRLEKTKAIYNKNEEDLSFSYKIGEIEKIIADNKDLLKSYKDLAEKNKNDIKNLSQALEDVKNKGIKLKKEKEERQKSYTEIVNRLKESEELKVKYLSGQKTMGELDGNSLRSKRDDLRSEIERKDSYIKDIEENHQSLVLAINEEKSNISNLGENIEKAQADIEIYEKDFDQKLKEGFENIESYKSYLKREDELSGQKDFVKNYFTDLEREKNTRENFAAYKDKEIEDLEVFKKDLEKISLEIKEKDSEKLDLSSKLARIKADFEKIKIIEKDYQSLKESAQIVSNLSDLANGVTGAVQGVEKLDFETFILSVYFDKVLNFANKRFNQMTDGQFSMVRKKEAANLRSKMGLDIEILDANTGKKRPASTLSGGENFLASLSLALGLSDEIGAENGGIRIDTLFIDEGFGTLSKEFLANAISTIEKLSKEDRFVGLISHVDELKDAIEAKILISYDPSQGSSLEIVND